jgi:hypothetical protein
VRVLLHAITYANLEAVEKVRLRRLELAVEDIHKIRAIGLNESQARGDPNQHTLSWTW